MRFPPVDPYPWKNYPYDYWNIWVRHAGSAAYMTEPTLEMLTGTYQVIVFKHCFPVSNIQADGVSDVGSEGRTLVNYRLQYNALKAKLRSFPRTRFIVWTGAALRAADTSPEKADRAKQFFDWVKNTWDEKGDNIYVVGFLRPGDGRREVPHAVACQRGFAPQREVRSRGRAHLRPPAHRGHLGRGDSGSLTGE